MTKKFYDVFPPNVKKPEKKSEIFKVVEKKKLILPSFNPKKYLIVLIGFVFIFLLSSYTVFSKAKIIIWPVTEEISFSDKIEVKSSEIIIDFENKIIPGEIFEIKEEESRIFASSGKETTGKKAEGRLKVYNNHSSNNQTLVENTRFISTDGKLFYSTERIVIPGKREEGGKSIPGEIEVSIRAAEVGDEYNIDKVSKFSVPGLHGTALYTTIYAENKEPISGGQVGDFSVVTKNDVEAARELLINDLKDRAKLKLQEEISKDFLVDSDFIESEVLEESFNPGIGESSNSFEYSIKINLKILSFKKSHLEEMAKNILMSQFKDNENKEIFNGKEIFHESLDLNFELNLINFREGRAVLYLDLKALSYMDINKDFFKESLSKKKNQEVEMIMNNYSDISEYKISRWPFWVKSLPKKEKINLEVKIKQ
jgi:hypothetical protein